jgi:hypothetical protein
MWTYPELDLKTRNTGNPVCNANRMLCLFLIWCLGFKMELLLSSFYGWLNTANSRRKSKLLLRLNRIAG